MSKLVSSPRGEPSGGKSPRGEHRGGFKMEQCIPYSLIYNLFGRNLETYLHIYICLYMIQCLIHFQNAYSLNVLIIFIDKNIITLSPDRTIQTV